MAMNKKVGLHAKYGDQQALKSYWLELLTDKEYAAKLAQLAREFVNERYSGQRMATEYTDLYQNLLSNS